MIQWAKLNQCIVIVSSSDATDHFEKYLNAGADYVILGEAEYSLSELIDAIEKSEQSMENIAGISYKGYNGFVKTQKRNVIKDLDSLPLPAWDLLDIEPYKKMWKKSTGYFSLNVATTRGCPFKCNWCAKPIYGNRYNVRSAAHVVKEIKMLKSNYGFDHLWFCDDIFGLQPGWVKEFAQLLKQESLTLRFKIQSRADLLLQEQYVEALADAGCETVWMGAESGSQKILDAMDKGITVEQITKATSQLRKHGIRPCFFIQFGYLDENSNDIKATIEMIHRLLPDEIGISISYPLPGTKFYEKVKQQLKWKANWTDSNDLALMFQNKQSPSFYKQLHGYVHKSYRRQLAIYFALKMLKHPLKINMSSLKRIISGLYYAPASLIARTRLRQLQNSK
jgi:anaerobic magnesium-protoporphyrin IX monomethyl ester cyclase